MDDDNHVVLTRPCALLILNGVVMGFGLYTNEPNNWNTLILFTIAYPIYIYLIANGRSSHLCVVPNCFYTHCPKFVYVRGQRVW
jgi:hypothetical protein